MIILKRLSLAVLLLATVASCKKETTMQTGETPQTSQNGVIPGGFNFSSTRNISVILRTVTNDNSALKGVLLKLYRPDNLNEPVLKGITDKDGNFSAVITLPSYVQTVIVMPHYIGLPQKVEVIITSNTVNCILGGKTGAAGNIKIAVSPTGKIAATGHTSSGPTFEYMGTYDSKGRPLNYLMPTQDVITADLLSFMNASLPDGVDTRTTHPEYLADLAKQSLDIVKRTDVWVTFVSEGAGNQNSFGYYVYDTNNPPQGYDDLSKITIVFPNVSDVPTGGGLQPGDKVNIGTFDAGKSIGFVCFVNAWNGSGVNTTAEKHYTDNDLNSEPNTLKKHGLLLTYKTNSIFLVSFEDLNRTLNACDHDFNDIVFYATTSETNAIARTRVPSLSDPVDTDGDGVTNNFDEYPNDPARAYTFNYPAAGQTATLLFEDNWPKKGDYDMNDLSIQYFYQYINNANNRVVNMLLDFYIDHSLADFNNGFGIEFPFSQSLISSVSGLNHTENYINLRSNGTEAGQDKAVIISFDNNKALPFQFLTHYITFTSPQPLATIAPGTYNPFLISNMRRGYEIHLPNFKPTQLASTNLLNTDDDRSNPNAGIYYIASNNLPWALDVPTFIPVPKEGVPIDQAYLHFFDWAYSNGTTYRDWYNNSLPGYVNWSKLN